MNKKNLAQIFDHYIEKFNYINNHEHMEYYKWHVCNEFPKLMKDALESPADVFASKLELVRKSTYNIIDSYTQPFAGLVALASEDPERVRKLLQSLYSDDGGDLKVQMEIISDFYAAYEELLNKYYPGSFRYKQNSHSVSAMLFLNDPDHHYMYKAVQSRNFAECIEFYDDWGTGDNIKLDKYYRMCDELIDCIKGSETLLKTDRSRYDSRLNLNGWIMHPDTEKHILAFDLIYCCNVYDLFSGVNYKKRSTKEKNLYLENKKSADYLKMRFDDAKKDYDLLEEAKNALVDAIQVNTIVHHCAMGEGIVEAIDKNYITVRFPQKTSRYELAGIFQSNLMSCDIDGFDDLLKKYQPYLRTRKSITSMMDYATRALKPYLEYLEG